MKKIVLSALLALGVSAVFAAEVIEIKERKDWAKGTYVKELPNGVWQIPGARDIAGAKNFMIDPAKKYTLSFDIRKTPDTQSVMVYAGYWCLDADMVRIMPHFARCEKSSATKLTADAKRGSKTIRITQPRRWKNNARGWCVSFVDQAACKGVDTEVNCARGQGEQAADGSIEITLAKPLEKDYPAGTAIHFHSEGPGMYAVLNEKNPSTEWETISVTISGAQAKVGIPPKNKWWFGSKYGKMRFLVVTREKTSKVELRNIKLTVE